MSLTIYDLTGQYLDILKMIEEGTSPEDIEIQLQSLEDKIEEKADGYAVVIKRLEADIQMIVEEEKRLYSRRKALEGSIDRIKRNLEQNMVLQGRKDLKTDKFSFKIQKNRMSAKILDEGKIPEEYKEIVKTVKVDKQAMIKAFQEDGELIDGVEFLQTESLRIR